MSGVLNLKKSPSGRESNPHLANLFAPDENPYNVDTFGGENTH